MVAEYEGIRKREAQWRKAELKRRLERSAPTDVGAERQSLAEAIVNFNLVAKECANSSDVTYRATYLSQLANKVQYRLLRIRNWQRLQLLNQAAYKEHCLTDKLMRAGLEQAVLAKSPLLGPEGAAAVVEQSEFEQSGSMTIMTTPDGVRLRVQHG
jgi:hypothetical protein